MNRRSFLAHGVSAAACALAWPQLLRASAAPLLHNLGLQLITVMSPLDADFGGTLKSIAGIGYRSVETLGTCGQDAATVRAALQKCGLVSPSQHLVPKDLYKVYQQWNAGTLPMNKVMEALVPAYGLDRIEPIIEEGIGRARLMGQRYLVWSVVFDSQWASRHAIGQLIRAFNTAGALCAKAGLVFAYHNGSKSFTRIGNDTAYDLILEHTDPRHVKMELDTYYAAKSGADALHYLQQYPGRFKLMHLKDMDAAGQIADLGKGTIDFAPLIQASMKSGLEHLFVEHDRPPEALLSAKLCFDYLNRLAARL